MRSGVIVLTMNVGEYVSGRSPIGRGSGLRSRSVWVRIPPPASNALRSTCRASAQRGWGLNPLADRSPGLVCHATVRTARPEPPVTPTCPTVAIHRTRSTRLSVRMRICLGIYLGDACFSDKNKRHLSCAFHGQPLPGSSPRSLNNACYVPRVSPRSAAPSPNVVEIHSHSTRGCPFRSMVPTSTNARSAFRRGRKQSFERAEQFIRGLILRWLPVTNRVTTRGKRYATLGTFPRCRTTPKPLSQLRRSESSTDSSRGKRTSRSTEEERTA